MVKALRLKPNLNFLQIWNMAFGFFGLQIGFALQNANASRIAQSLGADYDKLALFWLAGPVTGLIIQPIIGYLSDNTWSRFGRRRPYFLAGAILASCALVFMPNAPYLWIAAASLWILDSALNISMEPFRAFVGDNLNSAQRTMGYSFQGFFIGLGTFVGSKLPEWMGLLGAENVAEVGQTAPSVKWAFALGAVLLLVSVLWTVLSSKEYDPETLSEFEKADNSAMALARKVERPVPSPDFFRNWGSACILFAIALVAVVFFFNTEKQFIIFAALVGVFGVLFNYNALRLKAGNPAGFIGTLMDDFATMPLVMRRLAMVQFTSWFAFFILWVYLTPAVTSHHFGSADTSSTAYGNGALAVNDIFAIYGIVSMLFALAIPFFCKIFGIKKFYALALLIGGVSFAGLNFVNPDMFWLIAIGIGIVWACVLTLPYALLSDALPSDRMGTYMGIFNFFIVIPQLVVGTIMGAVLSTFLNNEPIRTLLLAGGIMAFGAILLLFVPHKQSS